MKASLSSVLLLACLWTFGQGPLLEDLWKLYQSRDYDRVIEQAAPYLETDSLKLDLNLLLGRTYTDMGDYKRAIVYLDYAALNDPNRSWRKAWALGYLGTCHFMLQDYTLSREATQACLDMNATRNASKYAHSRLLLFGFDDFYKDWTIYESDHFRFHFQSMGDAEIESFVSSRELAFRNIQHFFASTLPKKIDFFVWDSREDARKVLQANLGFATPGFCIVNAHVQQTSGHEMTHVISHYSGRIVQKTALINEGTAVCFDQSKQDREQRVRNWIKANEKQLSIGDVWLNWKDYPGEVSYPLSGLFVEAIIKSFGREAFLEFFSDQTYDHGKEVFGEKLDELIEDIENKLNT